MGEREIIMGTNDKKRLEWIKKLINDPPDYEKQRTKKILDDNTWSGIIQSMKLNVHIVRE